MRATALTDGLERTVMHKLMIATHRLAYTEARASMVRRVLPALAKVHGPDLLANTQC